MALRFLALLAAAMTTLAAADYRAGVARIRITPETPVWLSGFAARTAAANSVGHDLYAKALAIEDASGYRVVILTADLIGITREITSEVADRLSRKHGLKREQVLINASHTHSGPGVWPRLNVAPVDGPEFNEKFRAYGALLIDRFEAVASEALNALRPAELSVAWAQASFATNRRTEALATLNPGRRFPAPVDPRVPVLRVNSGGKIIAVLFGYACHNTVLTGNTNEVSADYAGYAQDAVERTIPGSTALFVTLCGGDQRPAPRGTRELAIKHGESLASAVAAAASAAKPVQGRMRSAFEETRLPFQVHTRELYAAEARSGDFFMARRGRAMLEALDAGTPALDTAYPVQAIAFGTKLVLLALGGEVVVDYALRFQKEYPSLDLIVAGYSNDVMGYIPSLRVLREGGYESGDAMMYFVQPGWFTEEVEQRIAGAAKRVISRLSP